MHIKTVEIYSHTMVVVRVKACTYFHLLSLLVINITKLWLDPCWGLGNFYWFYDCDFCQGISLKTLQYQTSNCKDTQHCGVSLLKSWGRFMLIQIYCLKSFYWHKYSCKVLFHNLIFKFWAPIWPWLLTFQQRKQYCKIILASRGICISNIIWEYGLEIKSIKLLHTHKHIKIPSALSKCVRYQWQILLQKTFFISRYIAQCKQVSMNYNSNKMFTSLKIDAWLSLLAKQVYDPLLSSTTLGGFSGEQTINPWIAKMMHGLKTVMQKFQPIAYYWYLNHSCAI